MARKRKYQYIADPVLKAAVVIERFVDEAEKKVDSWVSNYKANVKKYTENEDKQTFAALKLAGFYAGLSDPEVKDAIRSAINKAKSKQAEIVTSALPEVPKPIVSDDARKTAKKVADIIAATTPAT